jgi:hypothetical protein
MNYTLRDLEKDLVRLAKKAEALDNMKIPEKYQEYLNQMELTEKIVAPIYLAKQVELFGKYFDLNIKLKK